MDDLTFLVDKAMAFVRTAHHIVALTGAGISTPSGIPDFRSPGSGIWEHVDPMEVATIFAFRRDPRPFYRWLHPLAKTLLAAVPNPAHVALAQMEQTGRLTGVITQNIDLLHSRAGSQTVYELHGHIRELICTSCHRVLESTAVMPQFLATGDIPLCPACGGILKPNVVLYGEILPLTVLHGAQAAAIQCDLMIVAGSSLETSPANDLPLLAKQNGARLIYVNNTPTHLDYLADVVIHADVVDILPQLAAALTAGNEAN